MKMTFDFFVSIHQTLAECHVMFVLLVSLSLFYVREMMAKLVICSKSESCLHLVAAWFDCMTVQLCLAGDAFIHPR